MIAEEAKVRRFNDLARRETNHISRAIIFANDGFLDDAERELGAHLDKHSRDRKALELLQTINSWR